MLKKKLWLLDFANRKFGKQPVAELDVSEILKALGKMERRGRHETATPVPRVGPRFWRSRDSNSDRGTVKGTFRRRVTGDGQRRPVVQEIPVLQGFIRHPGDDRRWWVKLGESGAGALGEIRTNQPTYSIYKYFLAQSRTRGISRGSFGLQGCTEKCLSFKGFLMGEYLVSKKHPETHLRALFQLESERDHGRDQQQPCHYALPA